MKAPLALVLLYGVCALALERTAIVERVMAGSWSVAGAALLVAFALLRLVVVWVVPGWIAWVLIERAIARGRERGR